MPPDDQLGRDFSVSRAAISLPPWVSPGKRLGTYLSQMVTEFPTYPFIRMGPTIYCGVVEAIRAYIDGKPLKTEQYDFPTVYDGRRGMQFICKADAGPHPDDHE